MEKVSVVSLQYMLKDYKRYLLFYLFTISIVYLYVIILLYYILLDRYIVCIVYT